MNHVAQHPPSSFLSEEPEPVLLDPIPRPEHDEKARSWVQEETSLYLGLFSLTPLLLVFKSWAALPAIILAVAALWTAYKLHRNGLEAITLHASAWIMMTLGISGVLLFHPFTESEALVP